MALVPLAALGAVMLLGALPARRVVTGTAAAVCCLALVAGGAAANARRLSDLAAQGTFAEDARTLYALVPEDERDSFMAYRVEPKWYVYAKAFALHALLLPAGDSRAGRSRRDGRDRLGV